MTMGNMTCSVSFFVIPRFLSADAMMSILDIRSFCV